MWRPGDSTRLIRFFKLREPSVDFEQVQCPTALTDKTGCLRKDERVQLASIALTSSTNSSTSSPEHASLDTGLKAAIGVCVPLVLLLSTCAAYWMFKKRRESTRKISTTDSKESPDASTTGPELAARSVNDILPIQELHPIEIQEAAATNIHELNSVLIHEIEASLKDWNSQRNKRRHDKANRKKPLLQLPPELMGSSISQELEGDVG